MLDELEQSPQMDVTEESSSSQDGNSSETSQNDNSELSSSEETKPESNKEQYVPYERFKELIEQKNQFAKQLEAIQRENQEFKTQFESFNKPKDVSPEQKILERLKGIDPEFAQLMEGLTASKAELAELKQWKTQYEQTSYLNSAKASVERLQSDLKVDPTLHQMYLAQIPMGTPLTEVASKYKAIHDSVSKLFQTKEREALSKYTTEKKVDSKTPQASKGKTAKAQTGSKFSRDPDEARAQFKQELVSALRSQRQ